MNKYLKNSFYDMADILVQVNDWTEIGTKCKSSNYDMVLFYEVDYRHQM